jgi:hypothetical protein
LFNKKKEKKNFGVNLVFLFSSKMSLLSQGKYLATLVRNLSPIINVGEIVFSDINSVREYTVIVFAVLSDVDVDIDVLWSNDGSTFALDSTTALIHAGGPDTLFYERTIKGVFLQYRIENLDAVASTNFSIQTYAKHDSSLEPAPIPVPPPTVDGWWDRNPSDVSATTFLIPNNAAQPHGGGNIRYGNVQKQNVPNSALDVNMGTVFFQGGISLDWLGKQKVNRNQSYLGCFGASNIGVIMQGPGHLNNVFLANSGLVVTNSVPSGSQDKQSSESVFMANASGGTFRNVRRSVVSSCYAGNDVFCLAENPANDDQGHTMFTLLSNNIMRDRLGVDPASVGCRFRSMHFLRARDCQLYFNQFEDGIFAGRCVSGPALPFPASASGVAVITDNSAVPLLANYLTINAANGLNNTYYSRFVNGYWNYTNLNCTTGVRLLPGGAVWNPICDERYKSNLMEYQDTEGVLERLVACKVQTYHNKDAYEDDPVLEGTFFRITPTAQDFNRVFHPEEGDAIAVTTSRRTKALQDYRKCNKKNMTDKKREEKGGVDPTPEEEQMMDEIIEENILTPETQCCLEKDSIMVLNQQEYIAALHLSIKQLKKEIDEIKADMADWVVFGKGKYRMQKERIDVLEATIV